MSTQSKTAIPPESAFAQELEIFRTEAEGAAQFFYTYLGMHEIAKRHKPVFRMFDEHALFWNTLLGGVQTSALITLGRIFDQRSDHNIDTLLGIAQRNLSLFCKLPASLHDVARGELIRSVMRRRNDDATTNPCRTN